MSNIYLGTLIRLEDAAKPTKSLSRKREGSGPMLSGTRTRGPGPAAYLHVGRLLADEPKAVIPVCCPPPLGL